MEVQEARKKVMDNLKQGSICPCCDRYAKLHRRTINSSMAWVLFLMYKYFKDNPQQEWLHVENYIKKSIGLPSSLRGDYSKLAYWKLIERKMDQRDDGSNRNGFWKITEKGKQFLFGKIKLQKYCYIYNETIFYFDGEDVDIEQTSNEKFNYRELMDYYKKEENYVDIKNIKDNINGQLSLEL